METSARPVRRGSAPKSSATTTWVAAGPCSSERPARLVRPGSRRGGSRGRRPAASHSRDPPGRARRGIGARDRSNLLPYLLQGRTRLVSAEFAGSARPGLPGIERVLLREDSLRLSVVEGCRQVDDAGRCELRWHFVEGEVEDLALSRHGFQELEAARSAWGVPIDEGLVHE